ncbi:hypothetical protein KCTC52924_03486 [Arenibacter antarcticus]
MICMSNSKWYCNKLREIIEEGLRVPMVYSSDNLLETAKLDKSRIIII